MVPADVIVECEGGVVPGHAAENETSMALFLLAEGAHTNHIDRKYLEHLEEVAHISALSFGKRC